MYMYSVFPNFGSCASLLAVYSLFIWSVVAERSSALDSSSDAVGSNPGLAGRGACVLEQDA